MPITIYGLRSTSDRRIRYVGQTKHPLSRRLRYHRASAERRYHGADTYCARWIRSVWAGGHEVEIFPIEEDAVLHQAERRLIAWYRRHGAALVNSTDGGEGNHGYRWTPEQLENISRVRKGRVITQEWKAAISASSKGKPKPAGHGAKVSAARKGMNFTPEHRAAIGRASFGRRFSMPEAAKQRIAEAKRVWWAKRREAE